MLKEKGVKGIAYSSGNVYICQQILKMKYLLWILKPYLEKIVKVLTNKKSWFWYKNQCLRKFKYANIKKKIKMVIFFRIIRNKAGVDIRRSSCPSLLLQGRTICTDVILHRHMTRQGILFLSSKDGNSLKLAR